MSLDSKILDDYVMLQKRLKEQDKTQTDAKAVVKPSISVGLNTGAKIRAGLGTKPLVAKLILAGTFTSGSTAAQAPTLGYDITASSEYSAFSTLYDEYMVLRADNYLNVYCGTGKGTWVFGFDATDSTALTSTAGGLELFTNSGPIMFGQTIYPTPMTPSGFVKKTFVLPKGPQNNASGSTIIGTWSSTQQARLYGWLKAYVDAPAAGTTIVTYFVELYVAFRCRK